MVSMVKSCGGVHLCDDHTLVCAQYYVCSVCLEVVRWVELRGHLLTENTWPACVCMRVCVADLTA